MQDRTYLPRNFATLGPSELQPPFTRGSVTGTTSSIDLRAPGRPQAPYLICSNFAEPCVFIKQSPLPLTCHHAHVLRACGSPSPLSYGVILQSSFNIVLSIVLACDATRPPVSDSGTVNFAPHRPKRPERGYLFGLSGQPFSYLPCLRAYSGSSVRAIALTLEAV
jgi:hypothetical protein